MKVTKRIHIGILCLWVLLANSAWSQQMGQWDVYKFGAKGDGKTKDTEAIQKTIDECHKNGGGRIYLHSGTFISGTLFLRDNVILHIEMGAVLRGSEQVNDYPDIASDYPTYVSDTMTSKALIYGENLNNIGIEGRGTIDGNGDRIDKRNLNDGYLFPSFMYRPRIVHIRGSKQVQIKDVTLRNSGSWVQTYQECTGLVIAGITVDSRENEDIDQEKREYAVKHRNTDGLDLVDCERVRISNCFINAGDDAICLKSFAPDKKCRDIAISNCIVSSGASGIKIGTETSGTFEDITIQNCVVYDTRGEGIALMTADGARIERVIISGITLRNIKRSAIFIRLGTRNRTYGSHKVVNTPYLKDILIENVFGTKLSALGCSITGLPNHPLENISLKNIRLTFDGGGEAFPPNHEIPEKADGYPSPTQFGPRLPAYGFFIRNGKNISLDNIQLSFLENDSRPAVVCHDSQQVRIHQLLANNLINTPSLISLKNAKNVWISESQPNDKIPVFVTIQGQKSKNVTLVANNLQNSTTKVVFIDTKSTKIVSEFNNKYP